MKNEVTVNGVTLTRAQVENALKGPQRRSYL